MGSITNAFAEELRALSKRMLYVGFGRRPGNGYVDVLNALADDMTEQGDRGPIPDSPSLKAIEAMGVRPSIQAAAEPRTDLEPHIQSLFAAAALPAPGTGKMLNAAEVNELLRRAGICDPQPRIKAKMDLEAAGLIEREGAERKGPFIIDYEKNETGQDRMIRAAELERPSAPRPAGLSLTPIHIG